MTHLVPKDFDDLSGSRSQSGFVLVQLAEDTLLAANILHVQLTPHIFHHGDVVEDFEAVPVHLVARSVKRKHFSILMMDDIVKVVHKDT